MTKTIEHHIINGLFSEEEYCRKVLPHLKADYFTNDIHKIIIKEFNNFVNKYNKIPSYKIVLLNLKERYDDSFFEDIKKELLVVKKSKLNNSIDWLVDRTEDFFQQSALEKALIDGVEILNSPDSKKRRAELPEMLREALSVSFNTDLGMDYFEDTEKRWEEYNTKETLLPFKLSSLNDITNGGVAQQSLNCIIAGTGVGKSLFCVSLASDYLRMNKNVLYVSLEMAESKIAERVDANLLDTPLDELKYIKKEEFINRVESLRKKSMGKLKIKELPASATSASDIRLLIDELRIKKNFIPDVIMIDYINLMIPVRQIGNSNTYNYVKIISEEVRGLSQIYKVPIWVPTQTNRGGYNSSEMKLTDIAESFGLAHTCDFVCGLVETQEHVEMGVFQFKQLKNRYAPKERKPSFLLKVDKSKMRVYDAEEKEEVRLDSVSKVMAGKMTNPKERLKNKIKYS